MKHDYTVAVRIACKALQIPEPVGEYLFAKPRKFRADFCWVEPRIILEVEGGTWIQGRHSRGEADHEKYNLAASLGYRVFRTTPKKVAHLDIYHLIKDLLCASNLTTYAVPWASPPSPVPQATRLRAASSSITKPKS